MMHGTHDPYFKLLAHLDLGRSHVWRHLRILTFPYIFYEYMVAARNILPYLFVGQSQL